MRSKKKKKNEQSVFRSTLEDHKNDLPSCTKKRNHSRFVIDLTNTTKTINNFERKCDFPEK